MSPFEICRQLDGVVRKDPRAEVIGACRRASQLLRAGRPGAQLAVLGEIQGLAVSDGVRPALQLVLRWCRGETAHMNRAL